MALIAILCSPVAIRTPAAPSILFVGPEDDANGAAGMQPELFHQRCSFERDHHARAIIVLSPDEEEPDASVIKTILALTRGPGR